MDDAGLGARRGGFGTGRAAHVFVHSPLVPVVGALFLKVLIKIKRGRWLFPRL